MLQVALTGNAASGKSSVAKFFREWGAVVIDADAIVHDLQRPGTAVFQAIHKRFGDEVVNANGTLNRPVLRRRILADAHERRALERIVHPAVEAERRRLLAEHAGAEVIVSQIPLLFEAADPEAFDTIVLVDAPASVRRDRLIRLRGLTPADADALIGAQLPADAKRQRSEFVIENEGSLPELRKSAEKVWRELAQRAARHA